MSESTPVGAPSRTYTPMAAVEALLDASFAAYEYRVCPTCGRMDDGRGHCAPCWSANAPPIYGASLAGHQATLVYAGRGEGLPYPLEDELPCADCATANARIAALLAQNDALVAENLRLAQTNDKLRAHTEELAAQVRAGKHTPAP